MNTVSTINTMNTKARGNIAVGHAAAYFTGLGYAVFVPFGDARAIDLIVSEDCITLHRVQCKYTSYRKGKSWRVSLKQVVSRPRTSAKMAYTLKSFDFLFVTTPECDFLFDWPSFYNEHVGTPHLYDFHLASEKYDKYKIR